MALHWILYKSSFFFYYSSLDYAINLHGFIFLIEFSKFLLQNSKELVVKIKNTISVEMPTLFFDLFSSKLRVLSKIFWNVPNTIKNRNYKSRFFTFSFSQTAWIWRINQSRWSLYQKTREDLCRAYRFFQSHTIKDSRISDSSPNGWLTARLRFSSATCATPFNVSVTKYLCERRPIVWVTDLCKPKFTDSIDVTLRAFVIL